jgi:Tfp pilus assembly protein PilF
MGIRLRTRPIFTFAILFAAIQMTASVADAAKSLGAGKDFYESAERLLEKGDRKGAIIELKNALQADPQDLTARILLGRTYLEVENGASAAKELLRARRDGARDRFVLVPLGEAYLHHGLYGRILKEIRVAGQDAETAARIEIIRGQAQLRLQKFDEAEKSFVTAMKTLPNDEKALLGMAGL